MTLFVVVEAHQRLNQMGNPLIAGPNSVRGGYAAAVRKNADLPVVFLEEKALEELFGSSWPCVYAKPWAALFELFMMITLHKNA